jgi:multiple sugar transport system substrate-binding protein
VRLPLSQAWYVSGGEEDNLSRDFRPRKAAAISLVALAALSGTLTACSGSDSAEGEGTEITWFMQNQPGGSVQEIASRCTEESDGKYSIKVELLAAFDANQAREQLVRRLGAEDPSMDIIGMDVIWTSEFANAGWIQPWEGADAKAVTEDVFDSVVESASFENELYGAPLNSNTQVLWYRKDLVKDPPATWDDMLAESERLGDKGTIQVQANFYEGFSTWFNSMVESAGTSVIAGPEELELEQEPTERALELMGKLGNSGTAPAADIDTSDEGSSAIGFEAGDSAFMLNYTFAYASANANAPDIGKVMGAAPWPAVEKGTPSHPPLGGFNLGISEYSENADLAFEAAKCLTDEESQLTFTELDGLPPARESLYEDKVVEKAYPEFADLVRESIDNAAPRARTPAYTDLSLAIQRTLHPVRSIDPEDVTPLYDELRSALEDAVKREGLL